MECQICGSTNVSKVEDEKFITKTYKCINGHTFEVLSSGAKQAGVAGALALVGGLIVAFLTGKPPGR